MTRYLKKSVNGKIYLLHRYVYEQAYGPIPEGYHVHHINHDTLDNRLENLQLMTVDEHADHHRKYPRVKVCSVCHEEYEPIPTKVARSQTCSRECFSALASRQRTERNGNRKISKAQSEEILRRLAAGERGKDLAAEFGVSPQLVSGIKRRGPNKGG